MFVIYFKFSCEQDGRGNQLFNLHSAAWLHQLARMNAGQALAMNK
jgi:hypothetical protein